VVIGADRKSSYEYLNENYNLDVIISDDGLQHYKMPRTIEFCIVDAIRKYGNGFLLPAGPLRELPSRLKTVDLVVANGGTNLKSYTLLHTGFFSVKNDAPVKGEISDEALIVSAIGNPKRFEDSLRLLNVSIKESRHFQDHHLFTKNDFLNTKNINVLMTEKDAVKCQHFAEDNWYYLRVDAKPTEHLQQAIDLLLKDKEIV
jgi:tetraacyldisaccharide 4'-kinase